MLVDEYVRWGLQAASVALFLLVVAAGIVGHPNPTRNLAPTVVWILWWVGFAYLSALVGNLWAVMNPWATLFAWAERLSTSGMGTRTRRSPSGLPYPAWLGVWPAVGLFLAFAWIELISRAAIDPPLLALRDRGLLAPDMGGDVRLRARRLAPPRRPLRAGIRRARPLRPDGDPRHGSGRVRALSHRLPGPRRRLRGLSGLLRSRPRGRPGAEPPLLGAGLLRPEAVSLSMVAFVLTLLATVTFDGFTATPAWERLYNTFAPALRGPGGWPGIGTMGLLVFPVLFLEGLWAVLDGDGRERAGRLDGRAASRAPSSSRWSRSRLPITSRITSRIS